MWRPRLWARLAASFVSPPAVTQERSVWCNTQHSQTSTYFFFFFNIQRIHNHLYTTCLHLHLKSSADHSSYPSKLHSPCRFYNMTYLQDFLMSRGEWKAIRYSKGHWELLSYRFEREICFVNRDFPLSRHRQEAISVCTTMWEHFWLRWSIFLICVLSDTVQK